MALKQSVRHWLNLVVSRFLSLPENGSLIHATGGSSGLIMTEAYPVTALTVAETDSEVSNFQQSETRFIDIRTMTLWEKVSGNWYSRLYGGDQPFLRANTLCHSRPTGKMYYCDSYLRMSRVNLTTGSNPM